MTRGRRARIPALVLLLTIAGGTVAPADTISRIGDVAAVALPVSGLIVAGAHSDRKGIVQLAEAYGSTMVLVYILKPTIDRQRPDGGRQSFPSGHSASAFAGAAFLQRRYGWGYGVPAYALAGYVAWSRVEAKRHWTTDVIAGGAIGIAGNLVFTHRFTHVSLSPTVGPDSRGLNLTIRW